LNSSTTAKTTDGGEKNDDNNSSNIEFHIEKSILVGLKKEMM
jgi:hypothetical protein